MAGLNKVMIIGNCGGTPEMRFTPTGVAVTQFSVAVNRPKKGAEEGKQQEAEWFNVVAWRELAEICNQYIAKGSKVYVEGRMQTRNWMNDGGQKQYKTELIAQQVIFLSEKQAKQQEEPW